MLLPNKEPVETGACAVCKKKVKTSTTPFPFTCSSGCQYHMCKACFVDFLQGDPEAPDPSSKKRDLKTYNVEDIQARWIKDGQIHYLVAWEGYETD
jgi:hypothetical protein